MLFDICQVETKSVWHAVEGCTRPRLDAATAPGSHPVHNCAPCLHTCLRAFAFMCRCVWAVSGGGWGCVFFFFLFLFSLFVKKRHTFSACAPPHTGIPIFPPTPKAIHLGYLIAHPSSSRARALLVH